MVGQRLRFPLAGQDVVAIRLVHDTRRAIAYSKTLRETGYKKKKGKAKRVVVRKSGPGEREVQIEANGRDCSDLVYKSVSSVSSIRMV